MAIDRIIGPNVDLSGYDGKAVYFLAISDIHASSNTNFNNLMKNMFDSLRNSEVDKIKDFFQNDTCGGIIIAG